MKKCTRTPFIRSQQQQARELTSLRSLAEGEPKAGIKGKVSAVGQYVSTSVRIVHETLRPLTPEEQARYQQAQETRQRIAAAALYEVPQQPDLQQQAHFEVLGPVPPVLFDQDVPQPPFKP